MKKILIILFVLFAANLNAQNSKIQSGPMLGYSEMKEVIIWVQTKESCSVQVLYWNIKNEKQVHKTDEIRTKKSHAYTAKLIIDRVEPGNTYEYALLINNEPMVFSYPTTFKTQALWKYRGDPPNFSLATGSCAYINETKYDRPGKYGDDYEVFEAIHAQRPDLMIWLGDNFYYREPDWNSWTGIIHRNTHSRSIPELQPLLASTHHYAIWDDHDYGPNDSDRSFWNKEQTYDAFKLFWPNPSFGIDGAKGAITSFQYGDADFFLLDNRTYRSSNKLKANDKTILGATQLQWLKDALVSSSATFKIIALGGQFLTSVQAYETYSNNGFKHERDKIIDFIYNHNIKGVVFLSGDRHFTELSLLKEEGKPDIYDLTTSSLTAGVNIYGDQEKNDYRIPKTLVMRHNFSLLNFRGTLENRELFIENFDFEGKKMWDYIIKVE